MARKAGVTRATTRRLTRDAKAASVHARTSDSFQNFLARVGIGTENLASASRYGFNPISRIQTMMEWMYRGSWIVGRAVDCTAEDMTKAGVSWVGDNDPKENEILDTALRQFLVWPRLQDTAKWARLYGGAICVMLIDGQDSKTPLNLERIGRGQFKGLLVLDRWMVEPSLEDLVTDIADPDLGLPRFYRVTADAPALPRMTVHHSRVVRMEGVSLPYWQKVAENLWGMSVVERMYDRLVAYDSATQGASQLMYRAHLRTYKIPKLREIVGTGGPALEGLLAQMAMTRLMQSNEGLTLIDGEDEFETHEYGFTGIDNVLIQFGQQISGCVETPLVRLFGQSPSGLNSTGESDLRNYYDAIQQKQEVTLRQPADRLFRVVAQSTGQIKLGPSWGFGFNPLWQLTDEQKANVAKTVTDTVVGAEGAGVVDKASALKELRQSSRRTGIWTNITDEDIAQAKLEPAPVPGAEGEDNPMVSGEQPPKARKPNLSSGSAPTDPEDETDDDAEASVQTVSPEETTVRTNSGGPLIHVHRPQPEDEKPAPQVAFRAGPMTMHVHRDSAPRMEYCGIPIVIENPAGTRREGAGWSVVMPVDYGYIRATSSAEGENEQLDCFVGPSDDARAVLVIDQIDPATGEFDEHKVMFGFESKREAVAAYIASHDDRGIDRIGATKMTSVTSPWFVDWVANGDKTRPVQMRGTVPTLKAVR